MLNDDLTCSLEMAHFRMQNSALLCVSGRATSKPGNSSYFSTWSEIKQNNQITHGSSIFFNLIQRMKNFSNKSVQKIALSVVQWNGYLHTQKMF